MSNYLKWSEKTITDFANDAVNSLYNQGYLFGRTGKGEMYQTRSLRIDPSKFELSSENRRVLRKTENVQLEKHPLPYSNYHWTIGKLAKDFYDTKFGDGTFSANKVKEIMTDKEKSNFNSVFVFTVDVGARHALPQQPINDSVGANGRSPLQPVGYCIVLETSDIVHYCYPFYQMAVGAENFLPLQQGGETPPLPPNLGLGMMLKAIMWAKENGKKYVYLGSFSRPTDTYKLQFAGLEWWDGQVWKNDLDELKKIL